jgi:mycothiol system anti-sigma-R factor
VKCRKFQEQITASLDDALDPQEAQALEVHLAQCPECSSEYAVEKSARSLVRNRCKPLRTPPEVIQRISHALEVEAAAERPRERFSRLRNLASSIYFRPAVAFAVACFAIILIVNNNSTTRSNLVQASVLPDNDVIRQSLINFKAVSAGEIQPQIKSSEAGHVLSFFEGKTEFPVVVPPMLHCTLVGGVVNNYSGHNLAHVVYAHNDSDIIYIYETCWAKVQAGWPLQVSAEVLQQLKETGWYVAEDSDGNSIALWTKGGTLCAAVSRLDRERLVACLTAGEQQ